MGVDGEAIMTDMIYTGHGDDEGKYTQGEPRYPA
jgi:hypothetical protein